MTANVRRMVEAAHQESWANCVSSIQHDVHGNQSNTYKVMKTHNTAGKDFADIKVTNEEKWQEYFTRQWPKEDQLEADDEEMTTSIFSPSPSIGTDPVEIAN